MNETLVTLVRGLIGFFTLLILTRLIGKEQISQLTFFEYVLGITIGSIAASLTVDIGVDPWPQWVGLVTWTGAVIALQFITLKFRRAEKYLNGEPTVVIMNGQIMDDALAKMRLKLDEMLQLLRQKGVFDLGEVEFAVMETSGNLSVLKKSEHHPVTCKDLNIPTTYKGLGTELIYDGIIISQNLRQVNLDRQWLDSQLRKQGIADPSEVALAHLDTNGELYIDKYRDRVQNPTDPSDYPGVQ